MKTIVRIAVSVAVLLALALLTSGSQPAERAKEYLVYVGTYTRENSKGIYAYRFDTETGKLASLDLVAETSNPSFLAVHPNRRYLYAVSELDAYEGQKSGAVSAFAVDSRTGRLALINKVSSGGAGPCYVAMDGPGKNVLVANYGGGSVAVIPVKENGRLGEASAFVQHSGSSVNPRRQQGPHAHSINVSPDNRFAIAADLGVDRLFVYRFDAAKGSLAPNDPGFVELKPGAGPRHFAFHPGGRFVYAINELQSTVTAFNYDAERGVLRELQTISTLPKGFQGENSTAEVRVHPNGRFLYGSNRGHDSIAVFAIDSREGTLTPIEHAATQGRTPRNFGIDPTGSYLFAANQNSHNIVVFRILRLTGRLKPTGQVLDVPFPVCVKFLPVR